MKDKALVAVITPYFKESLDLLFKCHHSVAKQEWQCIHVLVGDGHAQPSIDNWDCHHIKLPCAHSDIGSTARLIGSYHAIGLGVDAVAFLDADNWYHPSHIKRLMEAYHKSDAAFLSTSRMLCRLDGSIMGPCPITNKSKFIDTNCMLFTKEGFQLLHNWVLMPRYGHIIGDRIMLNYVMRSGVKTLHLENATTVYYRCGKEGLYRQLGEAIPEGVEPRPDYESAFHRWAKEKNPPLT